MLSSDDYTPRSRGRYEAKRRQFYRGYLWPWVLVLLITFVLRFVMFCDVTFPFQISPSNAEVVMSDELQLVYKFSDGAPADVKIPSENEWSTRPDDRSSKEVRLRFPEKNEQDNAGVDNVIQSRQLGKRMQAIKRWDGWKERSRRNGEQQISNDQIRPGKRTEEKKVKDGEEELKSTFAYKERKVGDEGEDNPAVEERLKDERTATEQRRAPKELEVDGERPYAADELESVENGHVEEKGRLEEEEHAAEKRDTQDREAEAELKSSREREAEEKTNALQEQEAHPKSKAEKERRKEADGDKNEYTKQTDADKKNSIVIEEQTTAKDQKEDEGFVKVEESTEVYEHAEDHDQERREVQNDDERHSDSAQNYQEDLTTPSDPTQGASLAEEKREEEELKDAEGIEREMIAESRAQATEQEEKHQRGGLVIEQVTDRTQDEQPWEENPAGECNLFDGDWVWDPEGPLYSNSTCFFIQLTQNCMGNGRPDTNYLHWKWKPRGCDLPRFNAMAFLEAFRGRAIGFVGDSLARNQMQSLLCMLSQIEIPRVTYHSNDDSSVRWLFEQHQVTLTVVWSPYLLKESDKGIMGFEKGQSVLYLDELDTAWTSVMGDLDIMVLSIGQWYYKPSIYVKHEEVVGCHYCPGFNLTTMEYREAYQGAVRQVLEKVASEFKGVAIMSTFAIQHFEGGTWNNGGQCRREMPLTDVEEAAKFPDLKFGMSDIVISEFDRITSDKNKINEINENVKFEFLDVSKVSLMRVDGHPGPYRHPNPFEGKNSTEWVPNDCLHWCLPGPVDTWNQLLVKIVHRHL